jgi:hypothetical protein
MPLSISGNITELRIRDNLENIQEWRIQGFTATQIARKLGIKKSQLYVYIQRMPELRVAWNSADKAVLQEYIEPLLLKYAMEGFKYTEVVREPDKRGKMKITKETDKTNFNISALFSLAAKLDPEKWGKSDTQQQETIDLELDDSLDFVE